MKFTKLGSLLGLLLLTQLGATPALASNCVPFTYTLTNGQTADANQVMANFNTLLNCSNNNLAHNGANSDITQLTGLTTPLSVGQGGTGLGSGNSGGIPYFSSTSAITSTPALTQFALLMGGGAGGAPTALGPLTNGQLVIGSTGTTPVAATLSSGAGISITNGPASIVIAATATSGTLPTSGFLTTGSSATFNTPANATWLRIVEKGGGGGGGAVATNNGSNGNATSFNSVSAAAGLGGTFGNGSAVVPGGGGGTTAADGRFRIPGAPGQSNPAINGAGGASGGGAGGGIPPTSSGAGGNAVANSGGGGAGGSTSTAAISGSGGGEGEAVQFIIPSPTATYSYTVGTGGAGGAAGTQAGGNGAAGYIYYEAHYGN